MSAVDLAIVVGTIDFGDHDRVVRLLTADQGRVAVMARGVRSGRKPWATSLQTGALIRPELKRTRGALPLLVEASAQQLPKRPREDLDRLTALAYGIELCSALAPEHNEAERLFKLACAWLQVLEVDEPITPSSRQALEAKALTFAGFTPALVLCPICRERLTDPCCFSTSSGGGVHAACAPAPRVSADALLRLEALRRTPLRDTLGVRPAAPLYLLTDFAEWHLGAGLKSRPMLEEVEGLSPT